MTDYIIDDGGSATSPFDTWAKAHTSLVGLLGAITVADGDRFFVGHNHVDQNTYSGSTTNVGPTSGAVEIISCTQGTGSVSGGGFVYNKSSTNQIDSAKDGSYTLAFNGGFVFRGIRIYGGNYILFQPDSDEGFIVDDCTLLPGALDYVWLAGGNGFIVMQDTTIDCTQDTGATTAQVVLCGGGNLYMQDCVFSNVTNRTGSCLKTTNVTGSFYGTGLDLTGLTNATTPYLLKSTNGQTNAFLSHCKTAATWAGTTFSGNMYGDYRLQLVDVGPGSQPEYLNILSRTYKLETNTSITRTGGATVEGTSYCWGGPTDGLETTSLCGWRYIAQLPWIYGDIASTGTKTFDLYIVNDTADFDDDEVWLEVEYKDDASSSQWARADDRIATVTTTPAAQTDDTSTWSGSGPSYTYKQKLSVSGLTVGTVGMYRARVVIGLASIASSRHFYIDPKVTVS